MRIQYASLKHTILVFIEMELSFTIEVLVVFLHDGVAVIRLPLVFRHLIVIDESLDYLVKYLAAIVFPACNLT